MGLRGRAGMRRWLGASMIAAAAVVASGCVESFVHEAREHPDCVSEVQIAHAKVDFCMNDSNGHRRDFNACLAAQGVPDFKIDRFDACVEANEHHWGF